MTEILLTGEDIKKLAGNGALILTYPELYKYKSIQQLFSQGIKKVVILYLQESTNTYQRGHWCLLTKNNNTVSFFDSYSYMPDSEIKWNDKEKREELNQDTNYLTKLLYEFAKKGGKVEYNEMRFQKKGAERNTCGRHAGVRARFYEVPLKTYQKLFREVRKHGFDLDDFIVDVSNYLLQNPQY